MENNRRREKNTHVCMCVYYLFNRGERQKITKNDNTINTVMPWYLAHGLRTESKKILQLENI